MVTARGYQPPPPWIIIPILTEHDVMDQLIPRPVLLAFTPPCLQHPNSSSFTFLYLSLPLDLTLHTLFTHSYASSSLPLSVLILDDPSLLYYSGHKESHSLFSFAWHCTQFLTQPPTWSKLVHPLLMYHTQQDNDTRMSGEYHQITWIMFADNIPRTL